MTRQPGGGRRATGIALTLLSFACTSPEPERLSSLRERDTLQCPTQTVEGVDVYQGDGTIDWLQVQASGRAFAFIKATQGDYNTQSTFLPNWTNAKSAGLLRGAYHYFDATIDGVAQANHFLSILGADIGELPPMLDVECPTTPSDASTANNCLGNGSSGWVPTSTLSARLFDWLATVSAATGKRPIIFSYPGWFASLGVTDARLADYPLFISSYAACITVPAPWTHAAFWQYSAQGMVPGIPAAGVGSNADHDRWNGDLASLKAFAAADGGAAGAGTDDAAAPDASSPDASVPDASVPDASVPDASVLDASVPDASVPDASSRDASSAGGASDAAASGDGSPTDASLDSSLTASAAASPAQASGCGCRIPGASSAQGSRRDERVGGLLVLAFLSLSAGVRSARRPG